MPKQFTREQLMSWLHYDVNTGLYVWMKRKHSRTNGMLAGGPAGNGYLRVKVSGTYYLAHRLAWFYVHGCWPAGDIDHINGNREDNRIQNLRDVSVRVNTENRRIANKKKVLGAPLGVTWNANVGKWQATIKSKGKSHYLGLHEDAASGHQAYVCAKRKLHEGCTI